MREDTVTTKVYEFDELSNEAKEVAVDHFACINVDHEWWDSTFEDAKTIGLVIEHFDDNDIGVTWTEDAESTAQLILENHGPADGSEPGQDACETYKDAWEFQAETDAFTDSDEYEELCEEFKRVICEDYRIMLQTEYEYLGSEAAVIETIKANEYEFTAAGELY